MSSKHGKSGKKGTSSDDTLFGTNKADTIFGRGGNDRIDASNGNDKVFGGSGNDWIDAGNGNDKVFGGSGNDSIYGGAGNDKIDGGKGNDTIYGGAGNDKIDGGKGDDTLIGGAGNDTIDGGSGRDTAVFSGNFGDYTLKFSNGRNRCDDDDTVSVVRKVSGSPDGTDTLRNVEVLKFDDGEYRDGQFFPTGGSVNQAPVAGDDTASTDEDTPLTGTVAALLANDTDSDGDSLSVAEGSFSTTQGGTIVFAADGTYTYTPAANFNGTDTFDYTVTDGALSDVGRLTITVNAVNDAPVAVADNVITNVTPGDSFTIPEWALLANDSDPEGDSLNIESVDSTTGDFVGLTPGAGTDGFVTFLDNDEFTASSFTYVATDGELLSNQVVVNVTGDFDGEISGTSGNDILVGAQFEGTHFVGNGGNDVMSGGIFSDVFKYSFSPAGTSTDGFDTIVNFDFSGDQLEFNGLGAGFTLAQFQDMFVASEADVNGDAITDTVLALADNSWSVTLLDVSGNTEADFHAASVFS